MRFPFASRLFGRAHEGPGPLPAAPTGSAAELFPALAPALEIAAAIHPEDAHPEHQSTFLKSVAWISAGVGALALGVVVGREIRQRYKFNRRTPYDFYAHAGDERDLEFGVGI